MPAACAAARHVSGFSHHHHQQANYGDCDCCDLCAAVCELVEDIGDCVVSTVEGLIDRLKWFFISIDN
ncbi:unnamed protein product [Vitrella brassicaformis CCMP3155]|uniref:Uncharacterized protein n=1 Tax=Vitrella brassicaformis (strain CCMP3155) TaxID=1169540 RepID=A0A0G4FT59_VITBC|nr:unnamed protein product [Vitrella brassicaformis CCMP3155]|eukprot:CEM17542.1 unnamed protein product [Vitrella brassicaformis CCMP3155]